MTFHQGTYENLVTDTTPAQRRLFPQYKGHRDDFDLIVVGSGMGGGILADDLADRAAHHKRILVLEAGSYLYPTHVYNVCRFPNASVARHFGAKTFWQWGNMSSENYIHEHPQLNFGGRSVFWSGLIPTLQNWELDFFPDAVRHDLVSSRLDEAGALMNASVTMGESAKAIVDALRQTDIAQDFWIQETPRALHQPYLTKEGAPRGQYFFEPTGVFNTAELLLNQAGLSPGVWHGDGPGLHILLDHYVEDMQSTNQGLTLVVRNTLTGGARYFHAPKVILAGGSIESPKLLRRSSLFPHLSDEIRPLIGRGLTDHPTTDVVRTEATHVGGVPITPNDHAKIIFYSKGYRDAQGRIMFPFNIEMNINHEYWHLRENDPTEKEATADIPSGHAARVDVKFSFANCLDDGNEIKPAPPYGYVPEIVFRNLNWTSHLGPRLEAVAGWQKSEDEVFDLLNATTDRVFSAFSYNGFSTVRNGYYGQSGLGFGRGTVHHAIGTLRMPYRPRHDGFISEDSVVDETLQVRGVDGLYVCDMSVMPFSSAANPVRTLAALALRLSQHVEPDSGP